MRRPVHRVSFSAPPFWWLTAGMIALAAACSLSRILDFHFATREARFMRPLPLEGFSIRNDRFGKGYFGASRSRGRIHSGVDLAGPLGTPVVASKSGRVMHAGSKGGYGLLVEMLHPDGHSTRYAHLAQVLTAKGRWVGQGGLVGLLGKTGNAAHRRIAPHLHFEIRKNGEPANPGPHLRP